MTDYPPSQGTRIEIQKFDSRDRQMIELEKCLRRLKKKCEKDNIVKELKERQYYKKPSEVKREKVKNARRLMEKNRKKEEFYYANIDNNNNFYKRKKEIDNGSRFRPKPVPTNTATAGPVNPTAVAPTTP